MQADGLDRTISYEKTDVRALAELLHPFFIRFWDLQTCFSGTFGETTRQLSMP